MKTIRRSLKIIVACVILVAAALVAAVWLFLVYVDHLHQSPHHSESYVQTIARLRSEADGVVRETCNQRVPGLQRIIQVQTDTSDNDCARWTACATVEVEGASQGKIYFKFSDYDKELECTPDYSKTLQDNSESNAYYHPAQ